MGFLKQKKGAKELINNIANEFNLCTKLLGLDSGKAKCFAHQLNKWTGICVGNEKYELHHLRLRQALIGHKIKTWP